MRPPPTDSVAYAFGRLIIAGVEVTYFLVLLWYVISLTNKVTVCLELLKEGLK